MKKIFNVFKPVGLSPLDAIKKMTESNFVAKDEPATYAGRLDPMADGVLIVLAGESVYEKNKYLKLDKEYVAEILFGAETDTYDILGLPEKNPQSTAISRTVLDIEIKKLEGNISLPLPPYCSYKIKGKPLFQWARENKLGEIKIPKRKTKIHKAELLDFYENKESELLKKITEKISSVKGDFRQKEILASWQKIFSLPLAGDRIYPVSKIKIKCASGTYVRSIASEIGKKLNTGAVLLSLTRTKVGKFDINDSIKIFASDIAK